MLPFRRRVRCVVLLSVIGLLVAATQIRAAERVILQNGFDQRCDHHAVVDGHVRLYLGKGEESYIDLKPEDIEHFERMPDPVLPQSSSSKPSLAAEASLTKDDLNEIMASAGRTHNVDVDLLAAIIKAESGGNARAVSRTGARGLMQLMPSTAVGLGVQDSFKPDQNVRGGTTYIDALLERYHDNLALALAAYNAGPAAVDRYHGIPPYAETRVYVARVIHEFNRRVKAREAQMRASAVSRR